MERYKNWSYGGITILKPEAKLLAEKADKKEWRRTVGLSDTPIKQGIEARYFSFDAFGVVKYFNTNFDKRAKKFDEINQRIKWLSDHGERAPFIYGLGKRDTDACKDTYKNNQTDYVFMDNLAGEQLHNIMLLNTMRGFGPWVGEKWNDLFDDERQTVIDYLISNINLMAEIPQEDYIQLVKGMLLVYSQELAYDLFSQNIIYSDEVKPRFGFYDLRKLGNNPDLNFDALMNALCKVSHEIFDTLKGKNALAPDLEAHLKEQAKTYYGKVVNANVENVKLRKLVLDNNSEKSLVREPNEPESLELHKIHNDRLEKLL